MPADVTTARRGPLRVSFRAAPQAPTVLLAVPKKVGTAVVRNRARRRLRETLRGLVRDGTVALADGEYRLGVSAPFEGLSQTELRATMSKLLKEVRG